MTAELILPNAHRGGAPHIAIVGLNNIADGLVGELFTTREGLHLAALTVVEIQSLLSANGNTAIKLATIGQLA